MSNNQWSTNHQQQGTWTPRAPQQQGWTPMVYPPHAYFFPAFVSGLPPGMLPYGMYQPYYPIAPPSAYGISNTPLASSHNNNPFGYQSLQNAPYDPSPTFSPQTNIVASPTPVITEVSSASPPNKQDSPSSIAESFPESRRQSSSNAVELDELKNYDFVEEIGNLLGPDANVEESSKPASSSFGDVVEKQEDSRSSASENCDSLLEGKVGSSIAVSQKTDVIESLVGRKPFNSQLPTNKSSNMKEIEEFRRTTATPNLSAEFAVSIATKLLSQKQIRSASSVADSLWCAGEFVGHIHDIRFPTEFFENNAKYVVDIAGGTQFHIVGDLDFHRGISTLYLNDVLSVTNMNANNLSQAIRPLLKAFLTVQEVYIFRQQNDLLLGIMQQLSATQIDIATQGDLKQAYARKITETLVNLRRQLDRKCVTSSSIPKQSQFTGVPQAAKILLAFEQIYNKKVCTQGKGRSSSKRENVPLQTVDNAATLVVKREAEDDDDGASCSNGGFMTWKNTRRS